MRKAEQMKPEQMKLAVMVRDVTLQNTRKVVRQ